MRDDQNERYEGQDDSEYHYSDEEVNEGTSTAQPAAVKSGSKMAFLSNLTRSRRMVISGAVFFMLVLVVYKMVAPATTSPSTDISPAVVAQNNVHNVPNTTPSPQTVSQQPVVTQQVATQQPMPSAAPVIPVASPIPTQAMQQAAPTPMPAEQPTVTVVQTMPQTAPQTMPQAMPMPPTMPQAMSQTMPQAMPQTLPMPPNPMMATGSPATTMQQPQQPTAALPSQPSTVLPSQSSIDAGIAAMTATENNLTSQMQTNYSQKANAYEEQNKVLQDQLQTLNTRVTTMESQLNQLVQALMHQNQANAAPSPAPTASATTTASAAASAPAKIAYNVQAIIPGRAWLRSENGETITVAEGDNIKDAGRVTKIDPYDGVVEINTGNRVVSLSYGNGA